MVMAANGHDGIGVRGFGDTPEKAYENAQKKIDDMIAAGRVHPRTKR